MRTLALALVLAAQAAPTAGAQSALPDTTQLPPKTEPYEVGVLRSVYHLENRAFTTTVQVVNDTAYPVYLGAAPAAWVTALATGSSTRPAFRLTASQAANFGVTFALKNLIERPRPYVALDDIDARDRDHQGDEIFDPHSFPSGHTSTAFAIATSLSLSFPEWYVVVPAAAWASAMGAARVWHGVHYPSDVLVGAAIGATSAVVTHLVVDAFDGEGEAGEGSAAPVRIVVPL